jgi:hypothetical protein
MWKDTPERLDWQVFAGLALSIVGRVTSDGRRRSR